jgi:predicted PurR-regulated permease PerM
LLLKLVGTAADVFILLFLSVLVAQYLGAVADGLSARLRIPRHVGLGLAVTLSLVGLIGLGWLLVPPVIDQTQALIRVLPNYIQTWEAKLAQVVARVPALQEFWRPGENTILRAVYDQISGSLEGLVPRVLSLVHVGIDVFAVGVMGLYLALTPGVYREWLIALFPPLHRDLVRDVATDLGVTLRSWVVAQIIAMAILAVLTAIGLYALNVPYWLAFGVFTGVAAIVPFFGTLVSTVLPALFVLGGDGGLFHAFLVLMLGVVIHLIEGNFVAPLLMAKRVELPPVLTIMSVLVVGKLLGPLGLLVAVPLLAVIMVVVRRILIHRIYEGQGFRRSTRDRQLVLRVPAPGGAVIVPPTDSPVDILSMVEDHAPATAA